MKIALKMITIILLVMTLSSCLTRRDAGILTGGVIGGIAGNALTGGSVIGTGVGAVGGALVGNQVAR